MIHTLLAFDVDGTLSTSAGPVPWEKVLALSQAPGIACGIVSPSSAWPKTGIPAYLPEGGGVRQRNLRVFAEAFPGALLRIYVSNNGDVAEADEAGWGFMTEKDFVKAL